MENIILQIGTNTSGMDAGEIDYSFRLYNLERATTEDQKRVRNMLHEHIIRCDKILQAKGEKTSLYFKIWRIIDLKYFPAFKKNYSMWPIKLGWKKQIKWKFGDQPFITAHGWQNGWNNGARVYGWTLHIGNLLIKFGRSTRK